MAIVTNTFQTTSAVGNREELSNDVDRITPSDTPIYSWIGRRNVKTTHPEWEIDTLRAPAANVQLEGDEYAFGAITPPLRVGNYTQIFRQGWIVSNTQEDVDNAGNNETWAEKKVKSMIEVKKDVELSILSNSASVAGATRVSGGLPSWMTTNVSRGAGGANGGFNTGTKLTVAETTGTQRAFTKALLDNGMQAAYTSGGTPDTIFTSPYIKSVFVTFMSDTNVAPFRVDVNTGGKNTIYGTADFYVGPFGRLAIVPDRVMANSAATSRRVFGLDKDKIAWGWLRPIAEDSGLAKTGDAKKGMIIGEGTLVVKNEAALFEIADLFGYTSAS